MDVWAEQPSPKRHYYACWDTTRKRYCPSQKWWLYAMVTLAFNRLVVVALQYKSVLCIVSHRQCISLCLKLHLARFARPKSEPVVDRELGEHVIGTSDLHSFLYMLESSMLSPLLNARAWHCMKKPKEPWQQQQRTTMIALKSLLIWMGDMSLFNSHSNWCESNQKGDMKKQKHRMIFYCQEEGRDVYKCVISSYLESGIYIHARLSKKNVADFAQSFPL